MAFDLTWSREMLRCLSVCSGYANSRWWRPPTNHSSTPTSTRPEKSASHCLMQTRVGSQACMNSMCIACAACACACACDSPVLCLISACAAWKPSLTIKHLLIGIQTLLDDPNNADPAQEEPYRAFKNDRKDYDAKVKAQVQLLRS